MSKKVFVNGAEALADVRPLSSFAYKDTIKSLDKSAEARVELDGVRVAVSCVTSGRDVKSGTGAMKYHLYFYPTAEAAKARDTSLREWMPITAEEYRAYKNDPGYVIQLKSVDPVAAAAAPAPAPAETPAEVAEAAEMKTEQPAEAPAEPVAEQPQRKAKRVKA